MAFLRLTFAELPTFGLGHAIAGPLLLFISAIFCFGLSSSAAHGQVTFSLASTSDLSQLTLNEVATIQVNVSGATIGQRFDALSAMVTWDAGRFGLPSVGPGGLIPNNPADFLVFADSEIVDVAFLTFGVDLSDHVVADASSFTFYSFDVTAVEYGAGDLQLEFASATQFNPLEPTSPLFLDTAIGNVLPFLIAVPEPTGFGLLLAGVGAIALARRFSRR